MPCLGIGILTPFIIKKAENISIGISNKVGIYQIDLLDILEFATLIKNNFNPFSLSSFLINIIAAVIGHKSISAEIGRFIGKIPFVLTKAPKIQNGIDKVKTSKKK
jgi:hypothetical protein